MKNIKLWPHMTIIGVVIALLAGLGVAWWMKNERTASAEELPYAARIQRVDGEVAFSDSLPNTDATDPDGAWIAATPNQPFSVGDRIYTRDNARTSLAFTGRNFARLNPNTALDVVTLDDRRTQLALRDGSAMFDVGYLAPDELFEVATPYGAVNFDEPGLYNVGFDNNGGVLVSVLSGLAHVVGAAGSGGISKGEMLTLLGQTAAEVALSRLNGEDAGYLVDDYYRYQYPNSYDGRYNNYDAYLSDPYYYDPYRRNASYQYASSSIPGINDLDYYGDWQNVDGHGYAWRPRVDSNWVPYQAGSWTNDYPYGPTWVSNEPWGYAPYHYGRWANVGNQWYWIPDAVNTTPAYAPALVAFVPLDDAGEIGWVPLGPGDSYAPRYYDENWQPHYLTRANVVPAQLINLGIPGAVTVVPLDAFGRVLDRRSIRRIDQQSLASRRSTLDPLTLTPLRNAVTHSTHWASRREKRDLPPGIAKKLRDTRVFVGRDIRESRFRKDLAKSMRVERVSDQDRNRKFNVRDNRDAKDAREASREGRRDDRQDQRFGDRGRRQEVDRRNEVTKGNEATKGNRDAQRQARQTEQQQRKAQAEQERDARKSRQQPQGERVKNPAKQQAQPRAERQQQPQGERVKNSAKQPAQPRVERQQQPQGERVGNPAKQPSQPRADRPETKPRVGRPAPQVHKREVKQQVEGGAMKAERKQEPRSRPAGQGQGQGDGKAKGKGKP